MHENKPVITRFWLFAACVRKLLLMKLLGWRSDLFNLVLIQPEKVNQKRLKAFQDFFAADQSDVSLRVAVLCLRITTLATNLVSQMSGQPRQGVRSVPVRLAQGVVQERTQALFHHIVSHVSHDPLLDFSGTLSALLTTELHVHIRFSEYSRWPHCLWKLTQQYNATGYVVACEAFLTLDSSVLDTGYSQPLQVDAWRCGSFAAALSFLLSASVQQEIVDILKKSHSTTLPVERKNYLDRRSTSKDKSLSCARCSRNSILQAYRAWRVAELEKKKSRNKVQKKLKYMNSQALAIMRNPTLFARARGHLHWQAQESKRRRKQLVHAGDPAKLQEYVDAHRQELQEHAKKVRQAAAAAEKNDLRQLPVSNSDWMVWMKKHHEIFFAAMREATAYRQSEHSKRLEPLPDLGAVPRLRPQARPLPMWAQKIKAVP